MRVVASAAQDQIPLLISDILATPDSTAFQKSKLVYGVSQGRTRYCGYATAEKDGNNWKAKPALYILATDTTVGHVSMYVFDASGYSKANLHIRGMPLEVGTFSVFDSTFIFNYSETENGCLSLNSYVPDTTKTSFFKIVSYDPATNELKARFRLFLRIHPLYKELDFPETLAFDNGVIHTRRVKLKRQRK